MDIYSCELFAYRPEEKAWDPYQIHADAEKGVVYVGDHDFMKIHAFLFDGTYLGRVEETEGNLGAPSDFTIYEGAFPPLSTFELPDSDDFEAGTDISAPLTLKNHRNLPIGAEYPASPDIYSIEATVCLSISAYHPEHWQPAWGIRLILEALISFFPTPGEGAIGALDWRPEERAKLALKSRSWVCPECGPVEGLCLPLTDENRALKPSKYCEEIKALHVHTVAASPGKGAPPPSPAGAGGGEGAAASPPPGAPAPPSPLAEPLPPPAVPGPEPGPAAPSFWDSSDPVIQLVVLLCFLVWLISTRKLAALSMDVFEFGSSRSVQL
ncbi:hypothetical protein TeGR_g3528 [Tetraparma gracilis]|uniref:Uncharacterized protein n=1 Tax=Tetraparma gracilis TaxID=2962635 RepID=A0ABQ6NBZ8_9STRA|nr:hypothetical protein TeGR_g3528 [Tetraparma gracilis]